MKLLLFVIFIWLFQYVSAQTSPPAIQWQKSLGGSSDDIGTGIWPTMDGGYIITGYSNSVDGDVSGNHGNLDIWVVKLNNTGSIEWQKSLGGSGDDEGGGIQQTTDGGYIIAGTSSSNDGDVTGNHGSYDIWVAKLSNGGNIEWQKCLGGSDDDNGRGIRQTLDGDYIVTGFSSSNNGDVTGNHGSYDVWVVKLTSTGNVQWQKSLGGTGDDKGYGITGTSDDGCIITGQSPSNDGDVSGNHGNYDVWVVKLTSTGNVQWQKSLGGTGDDFGYTIQQTTDGGYITTGSSYSNDGNVTNHHGSADSSDCWVVRLNSVGNILWQKSLGGTSDELGTEIQETTDGGYTIIGLSGSNNGDVTGNHGSADVWLVKLGNCSPTLKPFKSISSGNWNDPSIWDVGLVPCVTSVVTVMHKMTVTGNASCYSLNVAPPNGSVVITTGSNLYIVH